MGFDCYIRKIQNSKFTGKKLIDYLNWFGTSEAEYVYDFRSQIWLNNFFRTTKGVYYDEFAITKEDVQKFIDTYSVVYELSLEDIYKHFNIDESDFCNKINPMDEINDTIIKMKKLLDQDWETYTYFYESD